MENKNYYSRDRILFYQSWYLGIKKLPSIKAKWEAIEGILEYAYFGNITNRYKDSLMYELTHKVIENNYKNYLNAKSGGAPKGAKNNPKGINQYCNKEEARSESETMPNDCQGNTEGKPKDNRRITEGLPIANANVNVNANVKDNVKDNALLVKEEKEEDILFISLPLDKTGQYKEIYQSNLNHYSEIYPSLDIGQELRNMKGWLEANPNRRKTESGIERFINNWLSKSLQQKNAISNQRKNVEAIPNYSVANNPKYDEKAFQEIMERRIN